MNKPKKPLKIAVIGSAHGIGGEVKVSSFTKEPMDLKRYPELTTFDGSVLHIVEARPANPGLIVRFLGIDNRLLAESLKGKELFIDRSFLPPVDPSEFYHCDLLGLCVYDETGREIGNVTGVHDFGAGNILELSLAGGEKRMIPFTCHAVPLVDLVEGRIFIHALSAGLEDLFRKDPDHFVEKKEIS